ncbi:hypothetical protein TRFO_42815 [Tritrichomonas foetus]|uniref:Uncharacterized protein n=1 Tax=Tritrichomonas foetus TaxID=1144522 RepID=A0A1J4KVL4_9EUKA|nr:hypothetical protein TRFO_42815 [Tritrichomonas foetus]|eukprot:OHT14928.1 hypothetical protein TRFO_42815 [Tritrichomonas foetus]
MPAIINPSTLSSIIRYLQSISLTLGIPAGDLPAKLETFVNAINNFFTKVIEYLPDIPDFDVRVRIVILSFAIPAILDFLFTWIVGDLRDNIQHIFDIAACFVLLFQTSYIIMSNGKSSISTYILIPVCLIYAIYRLYVLYKTLKNSEPPEQLIHIVDNIRNYYMNNIIPGTSSDLTEDDITSLLEKYNQSFVLKIVKPTFLNIGFILFLLVGLSLVICFMFGVLAPINITEFTKITTTVICSILILLLLIVLIMIIFPCLRNSFLSFRKFVRRYGVKVLMLLLDFLYIPVGRAILENFNFKKNDCGVGFYRSFYVDKSNYFDFLLDHNTTCEICDTILNDTCSYACFNNNVLYSTLSPHLEFIKDLMETVGPIIAFAVIFIIIGMPILTLKMVLRNKSIAWSIPVFGRSPEVKWSTLVTRLSTPGLFYFYMYKYNLSIWALFSPILKLLIIILTEIAERVNGNVSYAILVLYIAVLICYAKFSPYIYAFNNVLEIIINFSNAALTLVPICATYGKIVPSWFSIPLSIIICILPIIALPYALFCRKSEIAPEIDPGMAIDEDGKYVESIVPNQELHLEMIDLMAIWQVVSLQSNEIHPKYESDEINEFYCDDLITIGRDDLMINMKEMYNLIDIVCDATTTSGYLSMLKMAVIIASGCGGWFFGSIYGKHLLFNNTVC